MISTRLHGALDYATAAALAGLSASRALPGPVRGVLGASAAVHAGYALLTDYEAGLSPRLTVRRHLALDALGGGVLCAAGLLMRRQPGPARAVLFAAGLSELAIAARSLPLAWPPVAAVGYPPLDTPKPVANDVFVVDSLLPGLIGRAAAARMTVLRLPGGDLLLHSPTRCTPSLRRALERLGPVRHLVAPNVAHWMFLEEWQRACPGAVTWAAPGLRRRGPVRRGGVRLDHDLGDQPPPAWGGAVGLVTVPGGFGFHEVALFHRPSRTLLLADLAMNLEPAKLPAPVRPLARWLGTLAPDGMPPAYLRAVVGLRRRAASRAARRLVALGPERVVFAHGRWFEADGAARLRRSLRWLLD